MPIIVKYSITSILDIPKLYYQIHPLLANKTTNEKLHKSQIQENIVSFKTSIVTLLNFACYLTDPLVRHLAARGGNHSCVVIPPIRRLLRDFYDFLLLGFAYRIASLYTITCESAAYDEWGDALWLLGGR